MFSLDLPYMRKQERLAAQFTPEQKQDVADILEALFGTPDKPFLPKGGEAALDQLISITNLRMAAGAVGSDQFGRQHGLYRQHCAHCHGISGDGRGPTAPYLNPYPRDYRMGVFKFKSTAKGARPTHDDLKRILVNGIPGTAMPSFKLLAESEQEALIDYVKYLSVRGEVERRLYDEMAIELDEGERLVDPEDLDSLGEFLLDDILAPIAAKWRRAESEVTPVPARPDWNDEQTLRSIHKGKQLFYGPVANCLECHGEAGLGDGQQTDYDEWSKDFQDWTKVTDPKKRQELERELVRLGGLKPRHAIPRNLREGIYRGGRRPVDLYWRLINGIDGTPMPAVPLRLPSDPPDKKGLTVEELWHVIDYVKSLPYENMMAHGEDQPVYMRQRP
jgi:mono/diheme cytochrome c family protein